MGIGYLLPASSASATPASSSCSATSSPPAARSRIGLQPGLPDADAAVALAQTGPSGGPRPAFAHAMTKQMLESEHTMALRSRDGYEASMVPGQSHRRTGAPDEPPPT